MGEPFIAQVYETNQEVELELLKGPCASSPSLAGIRDRFSADSHHSGDPLTLCD